MAEAASLEPFFSVHFRYSEIENSVSCLWGFGVTLDDRKVVLV